MGPAPTDAELYDVVVVGAGPAGLTCAADLATSGHRVVVVDREGMGGRLVNAGTIANSLGPNLESASGPEVAGLLAEHAMDAGVELEFDEVVGLASIAGGWTVRTADREFAGRIVVLASGSRHRPLDVQGAEALAGRGVSLCAACDGPLFKGKEVVLVAGDERAADEAAQLAMSATSVTVLVTPSPDDALVDLLPSLASLPNVQVVEDVVVAAAHGATVVTGVHALVSGVEREFLVDGVFNSVTPLPNSDYAAGVVSLDDDGRVVAAREGFACSSNDVDASGVYVIGELRSGCDWSAVAAIAEGHALASLLLAQRVGAVS